MKPYVAADFLIFGMWRPATIDDVKQIVLRDLATCNASQIATFRSTRIEPCLASIFRFNNWESAVVVARKGDEVIYWEDVEEGFNVSKLAPDGSILDRLCNQDTLGLALNAWIVT